MSTKRKPNFNNEELKVLITSYGENRDIIDSKFSNNVSNSNKAKVWKEITDKVNSVNKIGFIRSIDDIKKKLISYKSEIKGKAARIANHSRATGGGPPSDEKLSEIETIVIESMNPQLITGIIGGIDTDIELHSNENTANDSIIMDFENKSPETCDEYKSLINISENIENSDKKSKQYLVSKSSRLTSQTYINQSEELLKIEKEKIELKKMKIKLLEIDLKLKLKELENRGLDVVEEAEELNQIISKF